MENKKCLNCGSENVVPIATNWLSTDSSLPLWHCNDCQNEWGKTNTEQSAAVEIENQLINYLRKFPNDKTRLMSIIKNFK